jgi:hypothetical protein
MKDKNTVQLERIKAAMKAFYGAFDPPVPFTDEALEVVLQNIYKPSQDSFSEVDLIEKFSSDSSLIAQYNNCRSLVKQLAGDADTKRLHSELHDHILDLGLDYEQLYNGNMLFFHALRTSPKFHSEEQIQQYSQMFDPMPQIFSLGNLTVNSAILQLYVALVYMRSDMVKDALHKNVPPREAPALNNVKELFDNDVLTHLRNAIAHGHIRPTLVGLFFKDEWKGKIKFEMIIPPRFADELCLNLYGFYYLAFGNMHQRLFPNMPLP